jgi:hypothetical protein
MTIQQQVRVVHALSDPCALPGAISSWPTMVCHASDLHTVLLSDRPAHTKQSITQSGKCADEVMCEISEW